MTPEERDCIRNFMNAQRAFILAVQDNPVHTKPALIELWKITNQFDFFFELGLRSESSLRREALEIEELNRLMQS